MTLHHGLQLVLSKAIIISDNLYHIQCSFRVIDFDFEVKNDKIILNYKCGLMFSPSTYMTTMNPSSPEPCDSSWLNALNKVHQALKGIV